jgi:hypothetical protein
LACGLLAALLVLMLWGAMLSAIWFVASGGCSLGGGDYGEINVISAHLKPCGAPSGLVVCVCFFCAFDRACLGLVSCNL